MATHSFTHARLISFLVFPAIACGFLFKPLPFTNRAASSAIAGANRVGVCGNTYIFLAEKPFDTATTPQSPSSLVITTPSPEKAASLAERDWFRQQKTGTWSEFIPTNEAAVRYILEGTGSISSTSGMGKTVRSRLRPGMLVEVKGEAQLLWDADKEMVVLAEGPNARRLVELAAVIVALSGTLLAALGGVY